MKEQLLLFSEKPLQQLFVDDNACLELLAKVKWHKGFICKKCGHTNSCPGKKPHALRCTRCKHEESAMAHTVFHNVKFPISKAFFIAYEVCDKKNKVSSYEFARRLDLRQMTCWKFKEKIMKAFQSSKEENTTELSQLERFLLL